MVNGLDYLTIVREFIVSCHTCHARFFLNRSPTLKLSLSLSLSFSLSLSLSTYFIFPYSHHLSLNLSIYLSIYQSISLSFSLSLYLSIYLFFTFHCFMVSFSMPLLSLLLHVFQSLFPTSICLSIYL